MKKRISFILILCILLSVFLPFCTMAEATEPSVTTETSEQGPMTFGEYLEQDGESWFLTGKRQYAVQAMMVSQETSFHNELEVTDYILRQLDGEISTVSEEQEEQDMMDASGLDLQSLGVLVVGK